MSQNLEHDIAIYGVIRFFWSPQTRRLEVCSSNHIYQEFFSEHEHVLCSVYSLPEQWPAWYMCKFASNLSQILFSISLLYNFANMLINYMPLLLMILVNPTFFGTVMIKFFIQPLGSFCRFLMRFTRLRSLSANSSPPYLIASAVML